MEPSVTDWISAVSSLVYTVLTFGLLIAAFIAWRTAKEALRASRVASTAATQAALAARQSNEQAQKSEIARSRPYVFVELLPSLAGTTGYDLRIANVGMTAARNLWLETENWPASLDDVAQGIKTMFDTRRTLPPSSSLRTMWRLEAQGKFTDGTTEAGMGHRARIKVHYTADDPPGVVYVDEFEVSALESGLWPVPESGPNPDGLQGESLRFYRLGQALVRRVGEFSR